MILLFFSHQGSCSELPLVFNKGKEALSLYDLKYYYLETGKGLEHCDSAAAVYSKELKKTNHYLFLLNEITRIALDTKGGQLNEALMKIEGLRYNPVIKKSKKLGGYLSTVTGNVLFAMSKPLVARNYYFIAYNQLIQTSDSIAIKGGIINIGNTYAIMNVADSAMFYYEKAVLLEEKGVSVFHFSLQNNLAHVLSGQNRIEEGIVIYESLVFNDREHLISSEFTTASLNLGRSYNILGRYSEAVSVLRDAVLVAKDSEIIRALPELLNQLSFAYNNTGESGAAYKTLLEADSIKDLLSHQHVEELMSDLEIRHKEEIFMKEQEAKSKELVLANKRHSELLVWLFVLVFLLGYIVILYVAKRKKNLVLVQQNLKLAKASKNLKKEPNLNIVASKVSIELKEKIQEALEKKKMFTDANLSLERFSKRISSNRTYVSEGINEVYAESFRSVINKMRVEEARSLLVDPDFENYSIEGVAITVGYRNISSFNSAFKRETGITPSYFKKSYLKSRKSMA